MGHTLLNKSIYTATLICVCFLIGCKKNNATTILEGNLAELVYLETAGPGGPVVLLILRTDSKSEIIINTRISNFEYVSEIKSEWIRLYFDISKIDMSELNEKLLDVNFSSHKVNTRSDVFDGEQVAVRANWEGGSHCVVWDNQEDLILSAIYGYLSNVIIKPLVESSSSKFSSIDQDKVFQLSTHAYCP